MAITLSIGERTRDDYRQLQEAGVDRYLLRFETTDPVLFKVLKPDSQYRQRFRCLEWLQELGYQVGSGNMVGLPGQTIESLADDILKFQDLDLDMIGLGLYFPSRHAAAGKCQRQHRDGAAGNRPDQDRHAKRPYAGHHRHRHHRSRGAAEGPPVRCQRPHAESHPVEYREHYLIYPDKICLREEPQRYRSCVEAMVRSLGRTVGTHAGHSLRRKDRKGDSAGRAS